MASYTVTKPNGDVLLANPMPQAEYMYGCVPTAVGMLLGYYDLYGYHGIDLSNLIYGIVELESRGTDGNPCDMDAFDTVLGRAIASEDYVNRFYSKDGVATTPEEELPYTFKGNTNRLNMDDWNCIADYLGTGQYWRGNSDKATTEVYCTLEELYETSQTHTIRAGSTTRTFPVRYITILYGLDLYVQSRGYMLDRRITGTYPIDTAGGRFTFEQYMAEIDDGRPVLVSITGHAMIGYGYNERTREIIFDDCYDSDQRMKWGGIYCYSGEELALRSITVIVFDVRGGTPLPVDTVKPKTIPQLALVCEENGREIHVISGWAVGGYMLNRLKEEYRSFYSPEQFKVQCSDGVWTLIPCPDVTNKTFVNGSVVHDPVEIYDGDVICVGNEVTKKTAGPVRVKFLSKDAVRPKNIPQMALTCEENGREIHVVSGWAVGGYMLKRLKEEYKSFYAEEQFKVQCSDGVWTLIPCPDVTNKTFVKGSVVHDPVELHDGDVICVGNEVTKKTAGPIRVKFLS